jgi:hypothetical protein
LRRSLADEFGCNLGPSRPLLADCNHDLAVLGRIRKEKEEVDGEILGCCIAKEEKW